MFVRGRRPEEASHELLIVATPLAAEAGRLAALARGPDSRLTVIVAHGMPDARWRWTINPDGGLDLGMLDLAVETHVGELEAARPIRHAARAWRPRRRRLVRRIGDVD